MGKPKDRGSQARDSQGQPRGTQPPQRDAQGGTSQRARQPQNAGSRPSGTQQQTPGPRGGGGPGRGPLKSALGTDPDMVEIVELFVREMPQRVEGLNNSWRGRDWEGLRSMAHQLKGASGGYGFPAVGNAAASLEMSLRSVLAGNAHVDLNTIRKQLDELVELCRSVTVK